ncbi:hypothetical protein RJ640_003142 [Escallonia rubra]|uniref:Alpha-ketoglutarate-dependent dioxygenase AlkB-like domain-containing protein n=2 Tax=Escallonia rubra TaxID=112253 RepID=A0AA88RNZ7_9ASTE|nr:hypothetical protein RJ640_003142 [Escallonia rubra]
MMAHHGYNPLKLTLSECFSHCLNDLIKISLSPSSLCLAVPPWLTRITGKISDKSRLFPSAINHVLINEYLPNQGIMPHQDGPAYFPVVAILSLGSPVVMDFTPHSSLGECRHVEDGIKLDERLDDERPFSVVLMPRSLLIFKDKAYSDYLHGIRDCEVQYYDRVRRKIGK